MEPVFYVLLPSNGIPSGKRTMQNLFLPLRRTALTAAALITVFSGFASPACAQEPNRPVEAAAADLSFYISPTKLVRTQSCERLLNSPEWADFFGRFVERFDERRLRRDPPSRLMNQLSHSFDKTPCSINDPLNLLFFNLQGIWGGLNLTTDFRVTPADPFLTFISDFTPAETVGLTAAFLDETGHPERDSTPGGPALFAVDGEEPFLLDLISPLPTDSGKSAFFLVRSATAAESVQAHFPASGEMKNALTDADPVFLLCGLNQNGLQKIADAFQTLPTDSPGAAFAPGAAELAKRVQSVWLSAQETSGVTVLTVTVFCGENESPADLRQLFEEVRNLTRRWAEGKELTPPQTLLLDLAKRSELIQENERLYIVYQLNAPETFEKIKRCFSAWK